ncbi:hypothetical protein GCM10009554_78250 [Kribbella koreensis]|uniref:Uncharacterized protein n=1 Tax=Kribbella koreensis TaxID=57909 RepID=A0ABN1RQ62_9ACTN
MSLYLVKDGGRFVWVAALIGEDIYTYVPDTGKFHRNEGLRDDYFMAQDLQYERVTVSKARAVIDAGLEPLDEDLMGDHLDDWRRDAEALAPEQVFASHVADLA